MRISANLRNRLGMALTALGIFSLTSIINTLALGAKAYAFGSGKMTPIVYPHRSLNWRVTEPKVVIAFGLLEEKLVKRYSKFTEGYFQDHLQRINPEIQVQVIPKATGQDVVSALMDRNTVGMVFISHSYKTENTRSTIMLGADGHPLPSNILSASTPALRFISFLGCYGPTVRKQYEIDFQFKKSNGFKIFYESEDKYLSANLLGMDHLKKILKKIVIDLDHRLSPVDLIQGIEPDFSEDGSLTVRVKDVLAQIEPRYIRINDQIIGVLGSDAAHSNGAIASETDRANGGLDPKAIYSSVNTDFQEFTYRVPFYAFQDFDFTEEGKVMGSTPSCHDVRILSAELTQGAPVDNYLIQSAVLTGPFGVREKFYQPAWHIGDQKLPPSEEEVPAPPDLKGSKREKRAQIQDFLLKFVKFHEWLDHDPSSWLDSPLKGRFYKDCF